ncbi:RrF2 family transcriptional regulator [Candidatus Latescibacterota bacterium]
MHVPQKSQYALRALFELAKHYGEGPVKIGVIAKKQDIPPKFLESIMYELKRGGIVESRRGNEGGYLMVGDPKKVTVGDILRLTDGSFDPVPCTVDETDIQCRLHDGCVFLPMWKKVRNAVTTIYESTTFQGLLDAEHECRLKGARLYNI